MFAPKAAKPQTNRAASSSGGAAGRPSPLPAGRTYGAYRNDLRDRREADPAGLAARGAGASWDFGKIAVFPPERPAGTQSSSPSAAAPLPDAVQATLAAGGGDGPRERWADRVAGKATSAPTANECSTSHCECDGCRSAALRSEPAIGAVTRRVEPNAAFAKELQQSLARRRDATSRAFASPRTGGFGRLSLRGEPGNAAPPGSATAGAESVRRDPETRAIARPSSNGTEIGVERQGARPDGPRPLVASISMDGEDEGGGDDDFVTAQTPAGPVAPGTPPAPAVPACAYSVRYANQRVSACSAGQCGAKIVFDIVDVTATGMGCPSLNGVMLTEVVTNDHGCSPANVQGGAGCPIDSHPPMAPTYGTIANCTDTYGVCLGSVSQSRIPPAGCTETVTQQIFVGGVLAETHFIRFPITKTAGGCTGTVNRT
jgi:hypothetical protein